MRKIYIPCECCLGSRYEYEACWVIFGSVAICEGCRLKLRDTLQEWGIRIIDGHPFMDELTQVKPPGVIHRYFFDS